MTIGELTRLIGPNATLEDATEILDGIAKLRRACDSRDIDADIVVTFRGTNGQTGTVSTTSTAVLRRAARCETK